MDGSRIHLPVKNCLICFSVARVKKLVWRQMSVFILVGSTEDAFKIILIIGERWHPASLKLTRHLQSLSGLRKTQAIELHIDHHQLQVKKAFSPSIDSACYPSDIAISSNFSWFWILIAYKLLAVQCKWSVFVIHLKTDSIILLGERQMKNRYQEIVRQSLHDAWLDLRQPYVSLTLLRD